MKNFVLCSFALLAGTLLVPLTPATQAAVILSNLDPASQAYTVNSTLIGEAILTGNRSISLTSVEFQQTGTSSASGETFSVYSRNIDGSLGSSLSSAFTLLYDSTNAVTTATATTGAIFTLQANTSYYFVLQSTSASGVDWVSTSDTNYASAYGVTIPATGNSSVFRFTNNGNSFLVYNTLTQGPHLFQVNGGAQALVPEPSSWAMLGAGAVGAGFVALRRRRAVA